MATLAAPAPLLALHVLALAMLVLLLEMSVLALATLVMLVATLALKGRLGEAGLAHILIAARGLGGGVRVLRAHGNELRSVPLRALLSSGERISELHLSHNQLSAASMRDLIKQMLDTGIYPLDAKRPLRLRLGKTPGCAGGQLVDFSPQQSRSCICVVDGHFGCTPNTCFRFGAKSDKPA